MDTRTNNECLEYMTFTSITKRKLNVHEWILDSTDQSLKYVNTNQLNIHISHHPLYYGSIQDMVLV